MKWLEIIEFNSREEKPKLIEQDFKVLIEKLSKGKDHYMSKVYSRVSEEIDFSIHLHHKSENIEKSGSQLGVVLSSVLKEHGLVKHSIWV